MALEPQREILAKQAFNTKCLELNRALLANRVLIFRFQLLAVHNCGECRIGLI
jgi:hypothetical protein